VQGNLRIFNAQADMLAVQRLQRFGAQGFSEGQVDGLGEGEGVRILRQLIGQSKDAHKMHPMPMFKPMQKIFCYAIFSLILSYLLQPGMILRRGMLDCLLVQKYAIVRFWPVVVR
jgi:hypothetical protein